MKKFGLLIVCSSVLVGCRASGPVASGGASGAPSRGGSASVGRPFTVFAVYADKGARHAHYSPSGFMGDSDLSMSGAYTKTPHGDGLCLRVNYKATGPRGWAGIFWQDPANNWGDVPGRAGYDLRGATRLTFWARGENGGERVHEFRMGGIVGQFPDSDVATLSNIRLTKDWKQYAIDLSKKDLRHIIAGFGFSVIKAENPSGMEFYLDDILYEGPQSQEADAPASAPALVGQLPAETTVQARGPAPAPAPAVAPPLPPEPVVAPTVKDLQIQQVESGLKVSFSSRLMFMSGQAVLEPASGKALDELIRLLSAYPTNRVLIEGHTDSQGDKRYNLRLSELRAQAVRDYLIKNGGIEPSRFQITGYGDTKPIADNATKTGRGLNRRVEATILKEK